MTAFLAALAAKAAGIKNVIIHSHNSSSIYHVNMHKVFKPILSILSIERFACSDSAGKWLFGNKRYKIIHNGIDLEKFKFDNSIRESIRLKMGWSNKKIIGHIGRFNEQKNHKFILEVFKKICEEDKQYHLVLVGKGEEEENIRKKINEYELNNKVSFLGIRDDVENLYQGMDLFMFPSLFEGLPVVLVETQASSLPCLISNSITKEVDFLPIIYRMDLKNSIEEWANCAINILNSNKIRSNDISELKNSGYDINITAKEIETFYYDMSK